jgi:hypothetical protein
MGENERAEIEWIAIEEDDGAKTLVYFEHLPALEAGYGEEHAAPR